ncbi:MAG: hypothetical protein ACOYKE_03340, partial [Ferruginibacter sp.]
MQIVNVGIKSETILRFVSSGKQYLQPTDDPFHISNNQWRIKPIKSESDAAILQRVKDYLHFHILYYKDAIAKDAKVVSFYGFPTCLKWYAGGIYIIKKDKLSEDWANCFYNETQAMKAYALVDNLLSKKYTWPKDNSNWVKKNLAVLEQMYKNL